MCPQAISMVGEEEVQKSFNAICSLLIVEVLVLSLFPKVLSSLRIKATMCRLGQRGLHSCSRVIKPFSGDQSATERLPLILN